MWIKQNKTFWIKSFKKIKKTINKRRPDPQHPVTMICFCPKNVVFGIFSCWCGTPCTKQPSAEASRKRPWSTNLHIINYGCAVLLMAYQ